MTETQREFDRLCGLIGTRPCYRVDDAHLVHLPVIFQARMALDSARLNRCKTAEEVRWLVCPTLIAALENIVAQAQEIKAKLKSETPSSESSG